MTALQPRRVQASELCPVVVPPAAVWNGGMQLAFQSAISQSTSRSQQVGLRRTVAHASLYLLESLKRYSLVIISALLFSAGISMLLANDPQETSFFDAEYMQVIADTGM
ncbi:hypothetical protein [Corynebacterium sp. HS2168-gen11]|uniref:hypothetical protein n=1 Tax=Corynebacterium sp. HS2168-gen11 TaxID=2974027 RepID=UPI00216B22F5|nr:hypothetical protein [Corynebacterium sp. HS2168-gen11]MCS4535245.1 hypothetical protein [Corynebacterium sp. HS2168-gen11]